LHIYYYFLLLQGMWSKY